MQTVNFNCGQCGNLMAVDAELLGQQVRCPHCGEVISAPADSIPVDAQPTQMPVVESPPEAPIITAPPEQDSIFAPPEAAGDDLFGGEAPTEPLVPTSAPWYTASTDQVTLPSAGLESLEPLPAPPVAPALDIATAAPFIELPANGAPVAAPAGTDSVAEAPPWQDSSTALNEPLASSVPGHAAIHAPARSSVGFLVVLIFLVPYAVCATVAAVYFYFQKVHTPHPLEVIPDSFGDNPGATRKKGRPSVVFEWTKPDVELPARDRVTLGNALTIGDLEVAPQRVERARITYCSGVAGRDKTPSQHEALVLTLRLRNVSADDSFYPADAAFVRQWRQGDPPANRPYTFLQVDDRRFYGGPLPWLPRDADSDQPREYIEGQENFNRALEPGQARDIMICTDPDDRELLEAVDRATGPLEWRVQLRRGLVSYRGRDIPTSGVVAVDFAKTDIH